MRGTAVFGREAELRRGGEWLASAGAEPIELVIVGEAGIGKTTVWNALLDLAREHGLLIASARASSAEAQLAFAALGDLAEPLLPWLDRVPPLQRDAVSSALLLGDTASHQLELRAVAVATLSLVRAAASERTVLLAIDDVQWLDPSSRRVVEYVQRRLPRSTALLTSVRVQDGRESRDHDLVLGPLSLSALHHLIRDRLGTAPHRPVLAEIERRSHGNPILALELARAVDQDGHLAPSKDFDALIAARLAVLPRACRAELVRLAASDGVDEHGAVDPELLTPAVHAGLVGFARHGIQFAHPLYAAAVLGMATSEERRAAHLALAASAAGDESRSRHLALAATGPDEEVAAALERSVEDLRRRGACADALALALLAVGVSPDGPARSRRRLVAAELAYYAGDSERALREAQAVAAEGDPLLRSEAHLLLAAIHHEVGGARAARAAADAALDAAGDDVLAQVAAHVRIAEVGWDDLDNAARHAQLACALMEGVEDPPSDLLCRVLMAMAGARGADNPDEAIALFEQAIELERVAPRGPLEGRASASLAYTLKMNDQLDRARELLTEEWEAAVAEGNDASLTYVASHLPLIDLWAGRWDDAQRSAEQHRELALQMGQRAQEGQAIYNLAHIAAYRGDVELTRGLVSEGIALASTLDDDHLGTGFLLVQGFLVLSEGNAADAVRPLVDGIDARRRIGVREPGALRSHGDLAEALVQLGRLDEAAEILDELEHAAHRAGHRSATALASRERAALAAAAGEMNGAIDLAHQAVAIHAGLGLPFDAARSRLTLGRVLRRAKQRGAAREQLAAAHEQFARLGARLWAQRADEELRRVGATRQAQTDLTPTELQVATLAARGMTNREVAAAMFMSPKTVEANLARAYRKLGTSSRAELGARLGNT